MVVRESGSPELASAFGYSRLEMHLPDGIALHAFAEPDPGPGGTLLGIEVLRLDPSTGAWDEGEASTQRLTFDDTRAWSEAVEELRATLSGGRS